MSDLTAAVAKSLEKGRQMPGPKEVTLTVFKTEDDLREVGTLTVRGGDLTVETKDDGLRRLVGALRVTASMLGGEVSTTDPDYALAVADSLARQSGWTYTAEPARG